MAKHKIAGRTAVMELPAKRVIQEPPEVTPNEAEIAHLAYSLWEARGFQNGSPEEDWFRAEEELRTRSREQK